MFFGTKIQKIIQICKYLRHFFTILVEKFIFYGHFAKIAHNR